MAKNYNSTLQTNNIDLQAILNTINELPEANAGGDIQLPELSNEGSADELFFGKQLINQNGQIVNGTFTIDDEITNQQLLIMQITGVANSLPEAGEQEINLQSKTVTPTTSVQNVTPDSGYDGLSKVVVDAIPDTYVQPTGTLDITTNGAYDVKNYESVDVNVAGGGSGGTDTRFAELAMGTLTNIDDSSITSLRWYAFGYIDELKTARLPNVTALANSTFRECPNLESVDLPNVTGTLGAYSFMNCPKLKSLIVPLSTNSSTNLCQNCVELEKVDMGSMKTVGTGAFSGCTKLVTLIIRGGRSATSPANLSNINAFTNTPIANGTGYIYVPQSMVDLYKAATNWVTYANQIRAIEDYPDICG